MKKSFVPLCVGMLRWRLPPKENRRIFSRLWRSSPLVIAYEFDGRAVWRVYGSSRLYGLRIRLGRDQIM